MNLDVRNLLFEVSAVLIRAKDTRTRIGPDDRRKVAHVVEVRVPEKDHLWLQCRKFLRCRADVSDRRPGTGKGTSLPGDLGIQEHNVPLERRREATDTRQRQDDEIISNELP